MKSTHKNNIIPIIHSVFSSNGNFDKQRFILTLTSRKLVLIKRTKRVGYDKFPFCLYSQVKCRFLKKKEKDSMRTINIF